MNKEKKIIFRVPIFIRIVTILLGIFAFLWAVIYILLGMPQEENFFAKIVPFIVLVLSLHVLYKNLFTINSLHITEQHLIIRFLLRPAIKIPFKDIKKIEFSKGLGRTILITYSANAKEKRITIPRGIQEIVEALNIIADRSPQVELDDFMKTVITK
jgi:hypothetical protein